MLYSHLLSFPLMSYLNTKILPRSPRHSVLKSSSVSASCLWSFLRLSLFWGTSIILSGAGETFYRMSPTEICLMVSSWLAWGCKFGEAGHRELVPWHLTQGTCCCQGLILERGPSPLGRYSPILLHFPELSTSGESHCVAGPYRLIWWFGQSVMSIWTSTLWVLSQCYFDSQTDLVSAISSFHLVPVAGWHICISVHAV
jgi:hypothetical protein